MFSLLERENSSFTDSIHNKVCRKRSQKVGKLMENLEIFLTFFPFKCGLWAQEAIEDPSEVSSGS